MPASPGTGKDLFYSWKKLLPEEGHENAFLGINVTFLGVRLMFRKRNAGTLTGEVC